MRASPAGDLRPTTDDPAAYWTADDGGGLGVSTEAGTCGGGAAADSIVEFGKLDGWARKILLFPSVGARSQKSLRFHCFHSGFPLSGVRSAHLITMQANGAHVTAA